MDPYKKSINEFANYCRTDLSNWISLAKNNSQNDWNEIAMWVILQLQGKVRWDNMLSALSAIIASEKDTLERRLKHELPGDKENVKKLRIAAAHIELALMALD